MTDHQINQAIAEACGIVGKNKYGPLYQTEEGWVVDCPNYCTDLNAMHEAEKALPIKKIMMYVKHLEKRSSVWFCADARQRAEAFLLTLGKWEEVQA